jgi:hypothetical protein
LIPLHSPMNFLPSSSSEINRQSIFWAVLSQTIWLPVFISASPQEKTLTKSQSFYSNKALTPLQNQSLQGSPQAFTQQRPELHLPGQPLGNGQTTGIVLNPFLSQQRQQSDSTAAAPHGTLSSLSSLSTSPATHPTTASPLAISRAQFNSSISEVNSPNRRNIGSSLLLHRLYSRSELLGGALTLQDLNEPSMPPLARAERAQWSRSGDPLAALPELWREPMRRALGALKTGGATTQRSSQAAVNEPLNLETARLVHVPSTRLRQAKEIPLALQADGSVDILNQPDDPAIIEEINRWSAKQKPPAVGMMRPAVVHLHPLPTAPVLRPVNVHSTDRKQPQATIPPAPRPSSIASPTAATPPVPERPLSEAPAPAAMESQAAATSSITPPAPLSSEQGQSSEGGS